jgi:hypothetical protein
MRTRSRLTTAAALAVSTVAIASPALAVTPYQDLRSADARDAARMSTPNSRAAQGVPQTVVIQPSSTSFDWESAAVGAGAALGLSAISLGGMAGLRHRRSAAGPSSFAH